MTRCQDDPFTDPTSDWSAIHGSVEFRAPSARRGRFVRVAAAAILTWYAVFLARWPGSVLSGGNGASLSFDELQVRSQTGLGSGRATLSAH